MSASSGGSDETKKSKKSVEEHFGSEVDLKIRSATGNPKVEQYFGSEVDLQLRTAEDPLSMSDNPKKIDLKALDSKPFKDATEEVSIRKLEEKLEAVKKKVIETDEQLEDPEDIGRKVSALFLAKVDEAEEADKTKKEEEGKKEQKIGFLDKMKAKKDALTKSKEDDNKLFEKQVKERKKAFKM